MKNLILFLFSICCFSILFSCSDSSNLVDLEEPDNFLSDEANLLSSKSNVASSDFNLKSSLDKTLGADSPYDKLTLTLEKGNPCYGFNKTGGDYGYNLKLHVNEHSKRNYARNVHVWVFYNGETNALPETYGFSVPSGFTGHLSHPIISPTYLVNSAEAIIEGVNKRNYQFSSDNSSTWVNQQNIPVDMCTFDENDLPVVLEDYFGN